MSNLTFHLIANAHLDPVWLWDWREGLNQGIITCRAILDLMDEFPALTCIRGEAALYEHIERCDPSTFTRIRAMVDAGRWDVVGGVMVQPDTNLTGTETFCRHLNLAVNYFKQKLGVRPTAAWAADSFGHSAGLPEIFSAAGMDSIAFTRPGQGIVPIAKNAFWWVSPSGARIMGYRPRAGWYGCERDEMPRRLDGCLEEAKRQDLENVGIFYGLGDHGGGPTRRHLKDIADWTARHPEVKVVHSGLHPLFAALRKEVKRKGDKLLPTVKGELNFCLRGCYSSVAKFKFLYRKTEALAASRERTLAAVEHATGAKTLSNLDAIWKTVCFNSFHDILPGSSIERAYDDQIAWLGGAIHRCGTLELDALNQLAAQVDTRRSKPQPSGDAPQTISILVWNPLPREYQGPLELEAHLDDRPVKTIEKSYDELPLELRGPNGKPMPFQQIQTEHTAIQNLHWRKRVVAQVTLPPMGWSVMELGLMPNARLPAVKSAVAASADKISNGLYTVRAKIGATGVSIKNGTTDLLGGKGLGAITVEDPWGSWGGMDEDPDSCNLSKVRHVWKIEKVEPIVKGPEKATLAVRMSGGSSSMDLLITLYRERNAVDVSARVFWNERSARLKLVLPGGDSAVFDVPGASLERTPSGENPGGRWVQLRKGGKPAFGFASDALYNFDLKDGALRATVCRASRYANDVKSEQGEATWLPVVDRGELRFNFLITKDMKNTRLLAEELEQPPFQVIVPSKPGKLPRSGSMVALKPSSLQLLAFKPSNDGKGLIARVIEREGKKADASLALFGATLPLGAVAPHSIATWRIDRRGARWMAKRVNIVEE